MGIPGSWSQNNEAFVHFAEPVSPYAAHPVTFQSIHVYWHYGGAYDINGAPSAPSGAAAAFAFDISTGDEDGPWTEILAEADPVTLAGVTYPDDFDLVFVLPSPVTAEWIQFRSTSAGNNDIYEIYLCEAADTEVELPPPPNAPITSTADPTADDGAPLPVGQTWINTTTGEVFVLVDNTAGAAVWVSTSGGVVDHGALTGLADDDHTQYVRKTLGGKEVVSTVAASGATETLDLASGNVHDVTLTADCTLTFTGATNGVACSFTLLLRQDGTGGWTTTWPGSVVWAGGTAPTLDETASTTAVLTFFTLDGGTVWYGFPTGGGASIGATVEDETTFGITPDAGASTDASAADHTHGSPANPVTVAALEALGVRGELVVVDGTTGPTGVIPSSYVEMTTPDTTTSATLEDIAGATTTITIQRPSDIAVWMTAHVSAGAVCGLGLAINIDGTDHDATTTHLTSTDEGNVAIMHRTVNKFNPGTYTVKGRMQRVSGGGTPSVDRVDLLVSALTTSGPVLVTTDDEEDYVYADLA
jgi:hypothetical protein